MFCKCFAGINSTEGLHVLYSSERIILKYFFNPSLQSHEISCCKFSQSLCFFFVNNRRQVASMYRGRIFVTNNNGEFEVIITNLSVMDAGMYRCGFSGFPKTYEYVEVTVSGKISVTKCSV